MPIKKQVYKIACVVYGLLLTVGVFSQNPTYTWRNPAANDFPVVEGTGWPAEVASPYDRFPERAEKTLNPNEHPYSYTC